MVPIWIEDVASDWKLPMLPSSAGGTDYAFAGADLLLCSAQKAMGGPTAGVIAGRRELVRACYAQQRGIGRPMKAGKEAVMGTIALPVMSPPTITTSAL